MLVLNSLYICQSKSCGATSKVMWYRKYHRLANVSLNLVWHVYRQGYLGL